MSKQRKTSFNQISRESIPSTSGSAMKIPVRATPLMRPSTGKMSLSAAKGSRGSMHMGQSDHHIVKDIRPISDKAFMKKSIFALVHFLEELGYPNPVYPKMMNPPTNRDYQRIFEYLVSHILGSYNIVGKPDEEMLRVARDLGYPFTISKSALNNVGTMSAWPHALGLLSWIMELVKYVCLPETTQPFSDDPRKQMKLGFFYKSYSLFMRGDDGQPLKGLIKEMKQQLTQLDETASSEVKDLVHSNTRLSEEYQMKINEKESNEHVMDEIVTQKNNTEKMLTYFSDIDKYLGQLKDKTIGIKMKTDENRELVAKLKEDISKTKTTISLQSLSASEAERLLFEIEELRKSIQVNKERLQATKEEQWDKEIKFGKIVNEMDSFVHTHNCEIKKLHEKLPQVASSSLMESLEKPSEEDCHLETGHNGVEVNNTRLLTKILPYLTAINKEFVEIQGSQKNELNTQKKRILQDKEMLDDLETQRETFKLNLNKISADVETTQSEISKQEGDLKKNLEEKQIHLEHLRMERMSTADRETIKKKQKEFESFKNSAMKKEADYEKCLVLMAQRYLKLQEDLKQMVGKFDETVADMDKELVSKREALRAKMEEIDPEIANLEEFVAQIQNSA